MTTRIDVFVDYVCPFCFLLEPAVEELIRDRDVEVTIRPFQLRPSPEPTLRPEDDYLPRVWRQSVYPMAERVGIPVKLPTISPQPRTEKAFIGLQLAQDYGLASEYSEAMFAAFFQKDRDIGDDEVIIEIAESVGLDPEEAREALQSDQRREQQRQDQIYAVNDVGVTAVPTVVVEGTALPGVPSATRLKKVVDDVAMRNSDAGTNGEVSPE